MGWLSRAQASSLISSATAYGARFPGRLSLHNHGLSRSSAPLYSRLVPGNTSTVVKLLRQNGPGRCVHIIDLAPRRLESYCRLHQFSVDQPVCSQLS
jgi:hypothetical protein